MSVEVGAGVGDEGPHSGSQVEGFLLGSRIGRGGVGDVYEATRAIVEPHAERARAAELDQPFDAFEKFEIREGEPVVSVELIRYRTKTRKVERQVRVRIEGVWDGEEWYFAE